MGFYAFVLDSWDVDALHLPLFWHHFLHVANQLQRFAVVTQGRRMLHSPSVLERIAHRQVSANTH